MISPFERIANFFKECRNASMDSSRHIIESETDQVPINMWILLVEIGEPLVDRRPAAWKIGEKLKLRLIMNYKVGDSHGLLGAYDLIRDLPHFFTSHPAQ